MAPQTATVARMSSPLYTDCRLCGSRLIYARTRGEHTDDVHCGLCAECHERPEARRFLGPTAPTAAAARPKAPRAFNTAEKALIAKVHAYMPAAQLLDILNTRLVADVGAAAVPFTPQQLQEHVQQLTEASARDGDWASLRKVIARARQSGLLAFITLSMVDDFAIVFSLSSAQHMRLKDVVKNAQEDR